MSEVFKLVIVYKTIFDLINNKKLQVSKHFDKKVNYCLLTEEGRNIFKLMNDNVFGEEVLGVFRSKWRRLDNIKH